MYRDILISSTANRNQKTTECLIFKYKFCGRGMCVGLTHTHHHKLRGFTLFLFHSTSVKSMPLQHSPLDKTKLQQDFVLKQPRFKIQTPCFYFTWFSGTHKSHTELWITPKNTQAKGDDILHNVSKHHH